MPRDQDDTVSSPREEFRCLGETNAGIAVALELSDGASRSAYETSIRSKINEWLRWQHAPFLKQQAESLKDPPSCDVVSDQELQRNCRDRSTLLRAHERASSEACWIHG